MVRAERLVLILRRLGEAGQVTLAEIEEATGTYGTTIREDLRQLEVALGLEVVREGRRVVAWTWSRAWLERQLRR